MKITEGLIFEEEENVGITDKSLRKLRNANYLGQIKKISI